MKSSTILNSVVFQLTPTRTRCDLVIIADDKTKKLASGLLNPFLAHLKVAQEQIGKGGYSIILEPDCDSDRSWFTKGTVERFIRFVSTPEILERVYTIESEILQIEEAISFQNNGAKESHTVQHHQLKSGEMNEGGKTVSGSHEDKAIVLYMGNVNPKETEGSMHDRSSSDQLLRVLEARKTLLQKEQGMAFARAVAAGFGIDHIAPLISFAECFGASRLKDGCSRFINLWKAKHESGEWLEIEEPEAKLVFSPVNTAGITLSSPPEKQKEFRELQPDSGLTSEDNGLSSKTTNLDNRPISDHRVLLQPHEYHPGHFSHPMFPSWPTHPQAGSLAAYQQYPMPMPLYHNYPGRSPFLLPPYPPLDESASHTAQKKGSGGNSVERGDSSSESENQGSGTSKRRTRDKIVPEEADSHIREGRKNHGKSVRKKSGMVVIRNLNYITSKLQNSSGSESNSESETEGDGNFKTSSSNSNRQVCSGDDGQWQAFQNLLLRDAEENEVSSKRGTFTAEGKRLVRKQNLAVGEDPLVPGGQEVGVQNGGVYNGFHHITGDMSSVLKPTRDEMLTSGSTRDSVDDVSSIDARMDVEIAGMTNQRGRYRRTSNAGEELLINGHGNITGLSNNGMGPLIGNGLETRCGQNGTCSHNSIGDSFIVPCRESVLYQGGVDERTTIYGDSDVTSVLPGARKGDDNTVAKYTNEPNDLNLIPSRIADSRLVGYDPALDYELHTHFQGSTMKNDNKEVAEGSKQGSRMVVKDPRSTGGRKVTSGALKGPIKSSKLSPSSEARSRADKLRSFKADLQKLKKAKEEEQIKRIEALKIERQKRIADRSKANPAKSLLQAQQTKKPQPAKFFPSSHKGSKFSDTEPGPPSPLQRSTIRSTSKRPANSQETTNRSRLNNHLVGSWVSRSASSLFRTKDKSAGVTPEPKATVARIKRLSEPRTIKYTISSVSQSGEPGVRQSISDGPNIKRMSADTKLDKTKSAILSELKTRISKGTLDVAHKKPSTNEQKMNETKNSNVSAFVNQHEGIPGDEDESRVVEKTVVMLECGKPSVCVADTSRDKIAMKEPLYGHDSNGKPKQSVAIGSKGFLSIAKEEGKEKPIVDKVGTAHTVECVKPKELGLTVTESSYLAPFAPLSPIEDSCMTRSEYAKSPLASLEIPRDTIEASVAHVVDNVEDKSDTSDWRLRKEISDGLKGLLKIGKGSHMPVASKSSVKSDKLHVDGSRIDDNRISASFAVPADSLKDIISQPETSSNSTSSKKSSRPFFLFSPFRGKTGDRKLSN